MGRRWRNVPIYDNMLAFALIGRRDVAVTSDWPPDAVVVNGNWNQEQGVMTLTIESASFDEVPVGNVIPGWSPTFTAHAVEPGALAVMDLIDRMKDEEVRDARARA
jgi:hypothetical protein